MSASEPLFGHGDIGPELRALAQNILDRIDPAIRAAAALVAARAGDEPGKCQQVWCPVCALAAVATGEQHPLLAIIAEHSVALLAMVRALLDATADAPDPPPTSPADPAPPNGSEPAATTPPRAGRYQHIPITLEE